MEPFLVALCNETQLEVLDQSIWKNRTIYYFNDCFQQAFIIAPINVVILTLFAFHLGFYSRYSFSLSNLDISQQIPERTSRTILHPSNRLILCFVFDCLLTKTFIH